MDTRLLLSPDLIEVASEGLPGLVVRALGAAYQDELLGDDLDADNVIGFGVVCGKFARDLDKVALTWAEALEDAARLDIVSLFLGGYWQHGSAFDDLPNHTVRRLVTQVQRVILSPDAARSAIVALSFGIERVSVEADRRHLAADVLAFLQTASPEVRQEIESDRSRLERFL